MNPSTPSRPVPGAYQPTPAPLRQPAQDHQLGSRPPPAATELDDAERAAATIDSSLLTQRDQFPELDGYVQQGISSDYVMGPTTTPFQRVKTFAIPQQILDQYNHAEMSTMMGLFADLNHAWVSLDNSLYMWDYTRTDPELIGFEEQRGSITAVRMIKPRKGVFIPAITRVLVLATVEQILLVGLSVEDLPTGGRRVLLYQTRMSVSVRGLDITSIESDDTSGRIFFSASDNDVYELYYQQEERWFWDRCWKINHTASRLSALTPSLNFAFSTRSQPERNIQLIADPSRQLLYSLSSASTIRVFHLKPNNVLELVINKTLKDILGNVAHMIPRTELIGADTRLVAIHPISSGESTRLNLIATTSTGCRIVFSATSSYSYLSAGHSSAPTSMQAHHVRFPPPDPASADSRQPSTTTSTPTSTFNTSSRSLVPTRTAVRYAPGYFLDFVASDTQPNNDKLFIAAPDSGQLALMGELNQGRRLVEDGMWMSIDGRAEDIGLVTKPFSASERPSGFGNELIVQHDQPTAEIAILTATGVTTFRRLRLVDEFALAVRLGRAEDGLEASVKNFIKLYGRGETAASAIAVACGQGLDVTNENRVASITDPDILDGARTAFIEYGGRPQLNENALVDNTSPIDMVTVSPRHNGLAMYISRLVRSLWESQITNEVTEPGRPLVITSTIAADKLQDVQQDLISLRTFLHNNRSFIDGLAGPEALGRVSTRHEEIALQAEHRALHALVTLITHMVEGISFVQMLFNERIEDIILSLPMVVRTEVRELTYKRLFASAGGRNLAKTLVRSIVNRNIQSGYNVDTVADSLRRRCGNFCSPSDVVIFKAQEQQNRAAEKGANTEPGRNLLNDSLRLYKQVVDELSIQQLEDAIVQYTNMQFYAGAIELALLVAKEKDRTDRALAWIEAGRPEQDPGASAFAERKSCYALVHQIIVALDQVQPETANTNNNRDPQLEQRLKDEAQAVIDSSDDEVFQTDLYDWYLSNNEQDKLLQVQSPFLVRYLQRKARDNVALADLLWKHHAQAGRPYEAAQVQLDLARSEGFGLQLDQRVSYLSRAKANASIYSTGPGRTNRQSLLRDISDTLDIANVQSDLLQRLISDVRLVEPNRTPTLRPLQYELLSLNTLYGRFAGGADYWDMCIIIYFVGGHDIPTDIVNTWRNFLDQTHTEALENSQNAQPWEMMANKVRALALRVHLSETIFPVATLLPMLRRYAFEHQRGVGPEEWVVDLFIDLEVPFETIFQVLQGMLYNDEAPFHGSNRGFIANDILHLVERWFRVCRGGRLFGSDANANEVLTTLQDAINVGMTPQRVQQCQELRARISQLLR